MEHKKKIRFVLSRRGPNVKCPDSASVSYWQTRLVLLDLD